MCNFTCVENYWQIMCLQPQQTANQELQAHSQMGSVAEQLLK